MNIKTMKKTYACLATAVLLGQFAVTPGGSYAAETKQETTTKQQDSQNDGTSEKNGFMGYYFTDTQFKDMVLMAPGENGELKVKKEEVKDLLSEEQQKIQSVRWMGYIKPSESGEYQFSTSSDEQVILTIDGNIVMNQSSTKDKIKLEKDKTYEVRIEYVPEKQSTESELVNLQLFWATPNKEKEVIPEKNIVSPDFSRKDNKNKLIPDENLFAASEASGATNSRGKRSLPEKDETLDTDDDSIPDVWEENGYTIQRQMAVKWDDKYAEKGYKKYRSNPYEVHTAGDPYTDIQKAIGKMDGATKKEAKNPLVAAYPNIGVNMESLVISKNQEVTESHGGEASNTISASTSNSKTNETSTGIDTSVSASIKASLFDFGGSVSTSVSTSFHESHSSTAIIENSNSNTSGTNWSKMIGMNTGDAAYLGARIRYVNTGTAPAYKVKPTMSLGIGEATTLTTVKAKENQIANKVNPGEMYPMKRSLPILLNKVDDFGSTPISINLNQLNALEKTKKIRLDSPQYDATVGANGHMAQEFWDGYMNEIHHRTARLVFVTPEEAVERRVAAKVDPTDPEDAYPEMTVEEALNIAVDDFKKTKDGYQYGDYRFNTLHFIYDEATAEKLKEQAKQEKDGKIDPMKMKLNAKMNIQVTPKGWVTNTKSNEQYYYDNKGKKVTGEKEIDGKKYYFDKDGVQTEKSFAQIAEGTYQMVSALNNTSVIDWNTANDNVAIWKNNNNYNQKWYLEYNKEKQAYKIKAEKDSSRSIAWNSNTGNNVTVALGDYEDQYWIPEDVGNGYYVFKNKKDPNRVLDVVNADTANGTNIQATNKNGDNSQKWEMKIANLEDRVKNEHKGAKWNMSPDLVGMRFSSVPTFQKFHYKVVCDGKDLGIRDQLSEVLYLNFISYNGGYGLRYPSNVKIYAVDPNSEVEILVAEYKWGQAT